MDDDVTALTTRLQEATRASSRILVERDSLQTRVENAEAALERTRAELAKTRSGWRHEIRCDTSECLGLLEIHLHLEPDRTAENEVTVALASLALRMGWTLSIGTAAAFGAVSYGKGRHDRCPACSVAAAR